MDERSANLRFPPSGVPTEPAQNRDFMALRDAARRMQMDRRTLQAAVVSGAVGGWARPGPERLRWFVYSDQVTASGPGESSAESVAALRDEVAALREQVQVLRDSEPRNPFDQKVMDEVRTEAGRVAGAAVADLRAENVSLKEAALLLLAAQEQLGGVVATMDGVAQKYREALLLFMTPGHLGELDPLLRNL